MSYCRNCGLNTPNHFSFCSVGRTQRSLLAHTDHFFEGNTLSEQDPNGLKANEAGSKLDAGKLRIDLIMDLMPRALLGVAEVGTFGAKKYTPGGWQHVADGETRYRAAGDRHRLYRFADQEFDTDSKLAHLKHEAWNKLAELELYMRRKEKEETQ